MRIAVIENGKGINIIECGPTGQAAFGSPKDNLRGTADNTPLQSGTILRTAFFRGRIGFRTGIPLRNK
jgi:hypothetical protein